MSNKITNDSHFVMCNPFLFVGADGPCFSLYYNIVYDMLRTASIKVFVHLFQTKRGAVVSSGLSPGAQAKPKEGRKAARMGSPGSEGLRTASRTGAA